jgi:peroxiredoxin
MKLFIFLSLSLLGAGLIGCRRPAEPPGIPGGQPEAADPTGTALPGPDRQLQDRLAALGFQIPQTRIQAAEFDLRDLEGRQVRLNDHRGKLVFLSFWATWCPPCRAEMPSMESLYRRLGNRGFEILAVDMQESREQVQKFVHENAFSFPVLLDETGRVGAMYGVRNIPTTYLIDPQGTVLARSIGGREWDSEEVTGLLREIVNR